MIERCLDGHYAARHPKYHAELAGSIGRTCVCDEVIVIAITFGLKLSRHDGGKHRNIRPNLNSYPRRLLLKLSDGKNINDAPYSVNSSML